jgi:hypothetical protein
MIRALENWLPICKVENEEKMGRALEQLKQRNRQPLQLIGRSSLERENSTLLTSALRSSELAASGAVSRAISEDGEEQSLDVESLSFAAVNEPVLTSGRVENT